jgi:cell division protein FtsZ
MDMALYEVDEAANRIREEVDPEANIIFGSTFDPSIEGGLRVSVVATGIDAEDVRRPKPTTIPLAPAVRTDKAAAAKPNAGFGHQAPHQAPAEHMPAAAFGGQDDYAGGSSVEDMPAERFAATGNAQQPGLSNPATDHGQTGSIELGQTVLKPNPALRQAPRAQQPQPGARQQHVADDNGDMPFIPPRAARPTDNAPARGEPDVYDAADNNHGNRPRFGGIRNLFGKGQHQADGDNAPRQHAAPQPQAPAPRQTELSLGDDARPQLKADPASRVKTSSTSDDLLEIPAFLRRQAN